MLHAQAGRLVVVVTGLAACLALAGGPAPAAAQAMDDLVYDASLFEGLRYRMVGPYRGGRVTAVAGWPERPFTFLMGTVGGGIWRTEDAGETWQNISDGYVNVGPIGALAVAPSDPDVIWAGTGSGGVRGNVSVGDGVYRSTDGGETWRHLGLPESEHINRIWVHPEDADVVWVAALGHIFGPNEERGVYRTRDGGTTWEAVLQVSDRTGAIDLYMSPDDPATLYAAMWTAERKPWAMRSGSTEGGVFKTTDGGDTWTKLTDGLPELVGRIGLAVSPAMPDRVYALVEAEGDLRGLYRSDDRGAFFEHVSDDRNMTARPWYYMHVDAHPTEPDVVFISNESFFRSDDAGESMTPLSTPHGDNHDLWINPRDPDIWIQSNDGGANVTLNAGRTWSTQRNQPTAEFYTVVADDAYPYRLYAPQQDNSTISVPSRITDGITPYQHWFSVAGCETGPIAVHPRDPDITYGGCQGQISRHDRETGQTRQVWLYPQEYHGRANAELRYREQWNSQIEFSPHDPGVLYHTSQYVHRTTDEGQSWEVISPDLTRWDEHSELHQTPPGGPLTYDQTGVEIYGTVFAFEESPHRPGLFWAGSDDGAVHISRDGGASWTDITPAAMALHTKVNEIVLSPHDEGRAFVVAYRYQMDDFRPYIYRTDDYGESWTLLTTGENGIPADAWTRALQEDPARRGLLYAGTERGLFISFDDGARWQPFQLNLPATPITDLLVKGTDLVVATQGRSLWILDDLTPLHQLSADVAAARWHLFRPRDAYRTRLAYGGAGDDRWPDNPPEGALIHYYLDDRPVPDAHIEITDADGRVVQRWSGRGEGAGSADPMATEPGMHRLAWDLKYDEAYLAPGVNEGFRQRIAVVTGYTGGPWAVPGRYDVTMVVGADSLTQSFHVLMDPRSHTTVSALQEGFDLSVRVRDRISAIQRGVARGQQALRALEGVARSAATEAARDRAERRIAELEDVLDQLYKHGLEGDHAHLAPRLTTSYARIYSMLAASDHRPADSAYQRFNDLEPEYRRLMGRLEELLAEDVT